MIEAASDKKGSKAKLSQAVSQRWISLCKMLLRVLERWGVLERFYLEKAKQLFPLKGRKDEVEEMFAVIDAVRTVVVYSQDTYESTAQGGLQRLVLLATSVLEPKKPLKVKHVPPIGQKESDVAPPALRPHDELTEVGAATREAFAKAVATRFVVPRYGKGLSSHSHRYDMAIFLSPGGRSVKYLDTLKSSTVGELGGFVKPASEVKERIVDQARAILIIGIVKARAMAKTLPVDVE
ncbi:unnamed protein product, partial [Laminaria digitata]